MKRTMLVLCIAGILSSCDAENGITVVEQTYTLKELEIAGVEQQFRPEISFWDEFGQWKSSFALSDVESMLLGKWKPIGDSPWITIGYVFFPNHLFIADTYIRSNLSEKSYLTDILGTWSIENNELWVEISGVRFVYFEGRNRSYRYETVDPYRIKLLDVSDIDSELAYSKKAFAGITLPKSVEAQLSAEYEPDVPTQRFRWIFIDNIVGDGKLYEYFDTFPEMAKRKLTGEQIVTDERLVDELIVKY